MSDAEEALSKDPILIQQNAIAPGKCKENRMPIYYCVALLPGFSGVAADFNLVLRLGGALGGNFLPFSFILLPLTSTVGGMGGGAKRRLATCTPSFIFTTDCSPFLSLSVPSCSDFLLRVCTPGFSMTAATSTTLIELAD